MRKKLICANWKMHKTPDEAELYLRAMIDWSISFKSNHESEVVIFPSQLCLETTSRILKDQKVQWGAQNIYSEVQGAFTGETSPKVLAQLGAQWALIGHSERRQIFKETDEMIAKKVAAAQSLQLSPLLCIGETLQQREYGQTFSILEQQLAEGLRLRKPGQSFSIAYEPVWAIGTGKVAQPQEAQDAHRMIRNWLLKNCGGEVALTTSILYGGSVKPDSAAQLNQQPDIDGFLVGGAALEADSFISIITNTLL